MWREVRATGRGDEHERGPPALNPAGQSWARRLAGVSAAEALHPSCCCNKGPRCGAEPPVPRCEGPAVRWPPNSRQGIIHVLRAARGRGCPTTAQGPRRVAGRGRSRLRRHNWRVGRFGQDMVRNGNEQGRCMVRRHDAAAARRGGRKIWSSRDDDERGVEQTAAGAQQWPLSAPAAERE